MVRPKLLLVAVSSLALSSCGYMSFAPPDVSLSRRVLAQQLSDQCQLPLPQTAAGTAETASDEIPANVNGALALIDNFIDSYRCTMRVAADGRQAFQLPGFLALTGAAAATALGGGPTWGITGGAASAMFNAGNGYYNPQEQAAILRDAIEALTCIQTEAVGVSAFSRMPRAAPAVTRAETQAAQAEVESADINARAAEEQLEQSTADAARAADELRQANAHVEAPQARSENARPSDFAASLGHSSEVARSARATLFQQRQAVAVAQTARLAAQNQRASAYRRLADAQVQEELSEIEVTPERQYFNMITAALLGVEVAAAQRLSRRGTFDAEGVRAQIAALTNTAQKNDQLVQHPPTPAPVPNADRVQGANPVEDAVAEAQTRIEHIQLRLDAMQPKLQQCILRAQV
jgi:hypothetical protein